MTNEILHAFDAVIQYVDLSVADIPDEDLAAQPNGIPNHAAWTLGHLAYSCQAIGRELGMNPWLSAPLAQLFATGSTPQARRECYPSKQELLAQLHDSAGRVSEAMKTLGEAGMAEPLRDERFRKLLPSTGHAALRILATHAAFHAGQLGVWRKAMGKQPVTGIL